MAAHRVTLIPGDGVGPEVVGAARSVLDATGVEIGWEERGAEDAAASVRETGVALKGPTSTPVAGRRSLNLALRAELDLHTSIRPVRFGGVDLVVARMNGEDLYAGIELEPGSEAAREVIRLAGAELPEDTGLSLKPLSASEAHRSTRRALAWAREAGRERVTIAHKATVMRQTDGVFLAVAREEAEAAGLAVDDMLVDTVCGELARRPERFDVLLAPVMYGDLLSDLAAGIAGGPGIAPNANLGDNQAVFEPVHGSAPRIAGRGLANPFAAILAGAMLLRHLGEDAAALNVEGAVAAAAAEGVVTYDLTASRDESVAASTAEVAEAVAELAAAGG
ncbi:MAG: isocitrate/isopropylmalate family dehydrogenase [Actinomycetota bacterium]|nr:isocitrate/isopropylmalate family dehydrogenase [Actinomycetota bacterium]